MRFKSIATINLLFLFSIPALLGISMQNAEEVPRAYVEGSSQSLFFPKDRLTHAMQISRLTEPAPYIHRDPDDLDALTDTPFYGTALNEPITPVAPGLNDSEFIYPAISGINIVKLQKKLVAPAAPEPPVGMSYPLAPIDGYALQRDNRYMSGHVYAANYPLSKMEMHKDRMLHLETPPNVEPKFKDGRFTADPIPGMVQLVPGIPFVIQVDGKAERTHTVACVQTLESLKVYPDYLEIEAASVQLAKVTWGCEAQGGDPEIKPIYEITGLKHNDRDSKRHHTHDFDGSFSLGPTIMKGNGPGTFLPAVQASTPEAIWQIQTVLHLLHTLYGRVMPKCLSAFEWSMINFHKIYNNVFCFGGLGPNGTGLQLNVSSLGELLRSAIGYLQGSWHVDEHDDNADWTFFTLLLRMGPNGDPGPFCLARGGVYVRELGVWIVFLVFKGVDLHSGFAPSEDPVAHQEWINTTLNAAWNLAGPQNRVGYVNYPGSLPSHRLGAMNVTPPTTFGNFGTNVLDKAKENNFAKHGQVALGGVESHANRLALEHLCGFYNALKVSGLTLDMSLDELMGNIKYKHPESGALVPMKPLPFNPINDGPEICRKLSLYAWHRSEADALSFNLTRKLLKSAQSSSNPTHNNNVDMAIHFPPSLPGISKLPDDGLHPSCSPLNIKEVISCSTVNSKVIYSVRIKDDTVHDINEDDPRIEGSQKILDWLNDHAPNRVQRPLTFSQNSNLPVLQQTPNSTIAHPGPPQNTTTQNLTETTSDTTTHNATATLQEPLSKRATRSSTLTNAAPPIANHTAALPDASSSKKRPAQDDDNEFDVEEILAHRFIDEDLEDIEFKIKWVGYEETDWVPAENLEHCIEMLAAYMKKHPELKPKTKPKPKDKLKDKLKDKPANKKRKTDDPVKLANGVNNLERLLDIHEIENQVETLRRLYDPENLTKSHYNLGGSSMSNIVKLWFDQASNDRHLSRYLPILPEDSFDLARIQFELLQGATTNLSSMAQYLKQDNIVQRCIRREVCRSLVTIFDWCSHTGPRLVTRLVEIHQMNGYDGLKEAAPHFADLVDHVVQHIFAAFSNHIATRTSGKPKTLAPDLEARLHLGPSRQPPSKVPFNLYGLRAIRSTRSQAFLKLDNPSIPKNLTLGADLVYSAAIDILQRLWLKEFMMPSLSHIDTELRSAKHTAIQPDNIYHRCITLGALLSAVASACGGDGIFASLTIIPFMDSPATVYEAKFNRDQKFAPAVIANRERMLTPLFEAITETLSKNPQLVEKAKELGNIITQQMIELHLGGPIDKDIDCDDAPAVIPKSFSLKGKGRFATSDLPNIQVKSPAFFLADLKSPRLAILGLILRETLNYRKGLEAINPILRNVLLGHHPTQSSAVTHNPDHTNPAREFSISFQLFQEHIPDHILTSRHGLSNLVCWFLTGQGYGTKDFLKSIAGFSVTSFGEMVQIFETVINKNTKLLIDKGFQVNEKGSGIEGFVNYEDTQVWGSASNFLSATPTLSGGIKKMTVSERFKPFWEPEVQDKWVNFLGDMLDKDPNTWEGPRKGWKDLLDLIRGFSFAGLGGGLTLMHCVNAVALRKIVTLPEPEFLATWISANKSLGAYRGLIALGFDLEPNGLGQKAAIEAIKIRVGFKCIYTHLDQHLSSENRALLGFNVPFSEHLLCKVVRWEGRLRKAKLLEHWERWIKEAEDNDDGSFPFPLVMKEEDIKNVIKETLNI